jgi:hypothetical protein
MKIMAPSKILIEGRDHKLGQIESLVVLLIFLSISFSDVTFNLFGNAETSPFPLLLISLIYLAKGKLTKFAIFFVAILVMMLFLGIKNGVAYSTALIALVAYFQIAIVYFFFKKYGLNVSEKLCLNIVIIHLVIGVVQYSGGFEEILTSCLSILMPRGSGASLSEIGRGVAFITTEPSHALQSILLPIFILSLSPSRLKKIIAILAIMVTLVLSQSGLSMIYVLVFIISILFRRKILIIILIPFLLLLVNFIPGRAGEVAPLIIATINGLNLDSFVELTQFSGFRFPSVYASLLALSDLPISIGLGAWELSIIKNLEIAGYEVGKLGHWAYTGEIHPVKPYSLLANIASDMWWLGVVPFLFFIGGLIVNYFRKAPALMLSSVPFAFFALSIFALLFLGTTGKASFVAILGIISHYQKGQFKLADSSAMCNAVK